MPEQFEDFMHTDVEKPRPSEVPAPIDIPPQVFTQHALTHLKKLAAFDLREYLKDNSYVGNLARGRATIHLIEAIESNRKYSYEERVKVETEFDFLREQLETLEEKREKDRKGKK